MKAPVLNITTNEEHQHVRINGVDHELVNVGELSILDYRRITQRSAEVDALFAAGDLSDEQVVALQGHLDWLTRLILRAPDEIQVRLSDSHRLAIIQMFTTLQRPAAAAAPADAAQGAEVSRG